MHPDFGENNILKHEENSAHCFFPHRAVIKWREKIRKEENPEEDKGEEEMEVQEEEEDEKVTA